MLAELQATAGGLPSDRDEWLDAQVTRRIQAWEAAQMPSLSIMVTKGSLDWAYPPFIVASTASALDWPVTMFFTFYGLTLLKKDLDLRLSGLGNPAMPMKIPYGPSWLRKKELSIPNIAMAGIPGFERMATLMMKKTLKDKGVAPVEELRSLCIEAGVRMIGCQMTRDLFGWDAGDFIPEIAEWAGAASYLASIRECQVNLYM